MIKKITIGLLVLLTGVSVASAQTRSNFEEEVSVGVHGGLNLSQVRFLHNDITYSSNLGDLGYRKGAEMGASVRFIAQKHFGVQLEVDYLQNGWKEKWTNPMAINEVEFQGATIERGLNYLSIPLLAHIYFGDKHRLFVNFGPRMAFLLNSGKTKHTLSDSQMEILQTNNPNDPRINEDIEPNNTDYALCAGAGYEFHISKLSVLAEARWNYGLHDVFEHSRSAVFQRSNSQTFTFTLGVMMPVFKFHSN